MMNLTIDRKALHAALAATGRAVSSRSSLPILANVLLEANGPESLRLYATDLDLAIERRTSCTVQDAGSLTLPAKTLSEIVAALPDGPISIETDDQSAGTIACGKSRFRIHGLPATEYPPAPTLGTGLCFRVSEAVLHRLISRVLAAVSRDDTRPVLTGAQWLPDGNSLKLVATDTHRLSVATGAITTDTPFEPATPIVPRRTLDELLRLLDEKSSSAVTCEFDANQARFQIAGTVLTSRLIEGTFPRWERVIPTGHNWTLRLDAADLRRAVKRAAIVAREDAARLEFAACDTLCIHAKSGDLGEAHEEIDCEKDGATTAVQFCLNANYLLDLLDAAGTAVVTLEGATPLAPIVLRAVGDESYFAVVMPMQAGA